VSKSEQQQPSYVGENVAGKGTNSAMLSAAHVKQVGLTEHY